MKTKAASEHIVHCLVIYDGYTEEAESCAELGGFTLEKFKMQFDVSDADPDMRDRYAVGPDDTDFLLPYLTEPLEFNFREKAYFIEALLKD